MGSHEKVEFVTGPFADTLPKISEHGLKKIAVLQIDGDAVNQTLQHLYEHVSPGGYIIVNGYTRSTANDALTNFFLANNLPLGLMYPGGFKRARRDTSSVDVSFCKPRLGL